MSFLCRTFVLALRSSTGYLKVGGTGNQHHNAVWSSALQRNERWNLWALWSFTSLRYPWYTWAGQLGVCISLQCILPLSLCLCLLCVKVVNLFSGNLSMAFWRVLSMVDALTTPLTSISYAPTWSSSSPYNYSHPPSQLVRERAEEECASFHHRSASQTLAPYW